jgi:multisubunit Na+/H+ antiporter MnhB subunit
MSVGLISDVVLTLLVLSLAVWITVARTAYRAVVGFVAYGLLMTLIWVRLAALDVAMTEAALGSGLTGILLFAAAARLAPSESAERARAPDPALRLLIGLLCTLVAAGLAAVVLWLPEPAPTLAPLVAEHLPPTGLQNPVTGVLLAHRAIDTLLESVVLLPALIGVWSVAADADWSGRPGSLPRPPASDALTLLAQILPPFGVLVAIHLVWIGADEPGGKFQAAAVLAAMWVLVMMAGLRQPPAVGSRGWRGLLVLGALIFIAIGIAGIWLADAFLAYPEGLAKPLIIAIEVALTGSVAVVLALLLGGPPTRVHPRGAG